jgi:Flp pilus assembly protein TadD
MKLLSAVLFSTAALAQPPPVEFVSVFNAYGQVEVEGYGPAVRARLVGCGVDSTTDSAGRFTLSGRVRAGGYLGCSVQVTLPGCDPLEVPLPAPAGSVNLGVLILKPSIKAEQAGSVSFLSLGAPPEVQKLKQRALKSIQESKWADAQRSLQSALQRYETDPESWHGIGLSYRQQGKRNEARSAFEKAAALDQRFVPPLIELSLMALQEKSWTIAIERGRQALQHNPANFPQARIYLATAFLNTGDFAAAEQEARGATPLPKAHHLLGVALAKLDRLPEAIQQFEQFLTLAPNAPEAATVREHLAMLKVRQ